MKTNEIQDQEAKEAYEPPRLEVMSLHGDEVMITNCKNTITGGSEETNDCLYTEGTDCNDRTGS